MSDAEAIVYVYTGRRSWSTEIEGTIRTADLGGFVEDAYTQGWWSLTVRRFLDGQVVASITPEPESRFGWRWRRRRPGCAWWCER